MTKRMLIDATHAEETRVVVLDGNRLEDFDVETSTKRQLKGNIYLAKVVRVEPSLQAAFVEYGGNRHGFLAFSEIHPDYYQIPIADRQRLIDQEVEEARLEEEAVDRELAQGGPETGEPHEDTPDAEQPDEPGEAPAASTDAFEAPEAADSEARPAVAQPLMIEPGTLSGPIETSEPPQEPHEPPAVQAEPQAAAETEFPVSRAEFPVIPAEARTQAEPTDTSDHVAAADETTPAAEAEATEPQADDPDAQPDLPPPDSEAAYGSYSTDEFEPGEGIPESPPPETVGGESDTGEDHRERRAPSRHLRNYKIQEVIKRRQILLVQVVKEERGTKGAALTTYLSLAGRFSVLMPNSPRGGGISRKITSASDRRRLKEIMAELAIPKGMGIIVRTAGAARPKAEIKRDCEYLLRLWDDIREHTLKSVAPALIYEEASLIKRAIRDVYSRDIDEIQVDGEEGWRAAHEFMRMLMPSHAKKVQLWRDPSQPLFSRHAVEMQLDGMLQPTVQLRSGGYLVINQAEALVAIDVNSGRSTRERGIEETALRTNMEAADEVARQLRLRDLAGLIVIDFIDMEAKKHNAMVERRIKEALKNDRARIQVGHISHFGLLEMSRQRLRPSLAETSFIACPHCGGTGHVRSTESAAIHVLRGIEEEGGKRRAAEIVVNVATPIALYILNHKRERLGEIEHRYAMSVTITGDDTQIGSQFHIDRLRAQTVKELPTAITPDALPAPVHAVADAEPDEEEDVVFPDDDADEAENGEAAGEEDHADDARPVEGETAAEKSDRERRRRRRRRRRGGRPEDGRQPASEQPAAAMRPTTESPASTADDMASDTHIEGVPEHAEPAGEGDGGAAEPAAGARLRRGRRGGRRRGRREDGGEMPPFAAPDADQPDLPPVYIGPTPANPFGGHAFDIFDVLEQAEANAAARPEPMPPIIEPAPDAPAAEPEIMNASAPEPVTAEPMGSENVEPAPAAAEPVAQAAPEMANTGAVEPAQSEAVVADSSPAPATAEFAPAEVANDVAPEPVIKPIIVGAGEEPQEKKRGWWRR